MNYDAETNEYRQSKKDCVIVSIANLLKTDYARVINALYNVGEIESILRLPKYGVKTDLIIPILKFITKKNWVMETPRRGAGNYFGLASWHRAGRLKGHMTIVIFGKVKDTDGIEYTIEEYRKRYDYVLRGIYVIAD